MELLQKSKVIKLRCHNDKYLVADDDQQTVRQSRNGNSGKARWFVETVEAKNHIILLRSFHGTYLTASDHPFLLGMTGKKVTQSSPEKNSGEWNIQWEPVRDGFQVRFRSWCGKFLRANGGTPPWRNSITHDDPHTSSMKNWILWDVEAVGQMKLDRFSDSSLSTMSSFGVSDDVFGSIGSPAVEVANVGLVTKKSSKQLSRPSNACLLAGMEFFRNAKAVRLRNRHDKYLVAEEDEESVTQDRKGSSKNARWTVEFVLNSESIIRLKSCYGKYLTASNQPFLLGVTGMKVIQSLPRRLDSSVEWEPVREGTHVKLQTRYGKFLRANGGLPPWRNSITHDVPQRTSTQDWILWDVDVIEIQVQSAADKLHVDPISHMDSMNPEFGGSASFGSVNSGNYSRQESIESDAGLPPPKTAEGRTIYYHIADENGVVEGENFEGYSVNFVGNSLEELSRKLQEETGMEDIVVCSRSPLNQKLFPLRLQLPPNSTTMHVVVVPSSSIDSETL